MAEPVRKPIDSDLLDEEPGITLERWVERPGGRMELVSMPLTPELFLNPQVGDKIMQGKRHFDTTRQIVDRLEDFFRPVPDVLVTGDMKHRFSPGLDQPGPDVAVIRGVRDRNTDRESFDAVAEGVRPCLIIEIVSPLSSRIRKTDLEDKVTLYRRAGIPEYLIIDCQRQDRRFRLIGYRLGGAGYQRIEPDEKGRLLSETTGLWFQAAPDGDHVLIFEHPSGRPLPTREELDQERLAAEEKALIEAQARKAAEEKALIEARAREAAEEKTLVEARAREAAEESCKAAEEEIRRLRAEIERLRQT